MCTSNHPLRSRVAFTLVELLVVIAIIAVLIAILLPTLRKAKESANSVVCQSNQRQLMAGFLMFAQDHNNSLPGNKRDRGDPVEWKRDWLFNGGGVLTVILPEFVPAHWWEQLLHNQTALRLKGALLGRPGIVVISVPYHLLGRARALPTVTY